MKRRVELRRRLLMKLSRQLQPRRANSMNNQPISTNPSDGQHHPVQSQTISAPDRYDVVCGCGRRIQRIPGNQTYRKLVSVNKVR